MDNAGDAVPRGYLTILSPGEALKIESSWIASPDNPLTSRAIVNRIWHYLFGRGIVSTVDNFGATDEYGISAVKNKMHFHDLHATMLHLLGLDHKRLTYRYTGRDFRLTDVYGRVAHEIIA